MKYDKEHITKFIDALKEGQGRVRACKTAGINYTTFLRWYETKSKFNTLVKKAEEQGSNTIEEFCLSKILKSDTWQSAAWVLERMFQTKYALNKPLNAETTGKIIVEPDN